MIFFFQKRIFYALFIELIYDFSEKLLQYPEINDIKIHCGDRLAAAKFTIFLENNVNKFSQIKKEAFLSFLIVRTNKKQFLKPGQRISM